MASRVVTVAFQGVEARRVDVEVQLASGEVRFMLVGLGDKAVAESRERVRAAFAGLGLAMPSRRIIANLAPADLPKEGSHYDLPIALAVMASMGVLPPDALAEWAAMGELSLDGRIVGVAGALPAAVAAGGMGLGLICPEASGAEAAWAGDVRILAAPSLVAVVNHFRGTQLLSPPKPGPMSEGERVPDLRDVKGQENAKRALEIAAAGGHNLLFTGPPGSGKSMMAARLPGLLPPLSPSELLETSMVHSVAGLIAKGELTRARPFRTPHHSASMAALTGYEFPMIMRYAIESEKNARRGLRSPRMGLCVNPHLHQQAGYQSLTFDRVEKLDRPGTSKCGSGAVSPFSDALGRRFKHTRRRRTPVWLAEDFDVLCRSIFASSSLPAAA